MGTIISGILGGFSGKVGSVVGGSWKGIDYMRAIPQSVSDPKTPGQVNQRNKFSLVGKFIKSVNEVVAVGYRHYAHKQTGANAAMSYILKNCVIPDADGYAIDYEKVLLSRGNLIGVEVTDVRLERQMVIIDWVDNTGTDNASRDDYIMSLAYNINKGESIYRVDSPLRHTQILGMTYPSSWVGDKVVVYLGLASKDGKLISESQYLGEYPVPAGE